ncbi:ATP-dependent Clp protease proteolytic subunit-related protein 4, chloroplastic, partial [Tanacetum coccineum]
MSTPTRKGRKNPLSTFEFNRVIPFSRGSAWEQPPPDLASYLYKNRIVYLGMSLVPSVTELILAEFLYLQYEDDKKPIYLYINSTGTTK